MKSLEWREATVQMNKTPDTMKMDLGQNIIQKITADFLWGKGQLSMRTLTYKVASNLKKSLILFIFILLSSKASSLYVSNSTFPSPQKKTTDTIESSHPEPDKGLIHRWPFVLRCIHVS